MYPGLSHAKRIEDAGVRLGVAVLARLRRRDGDDLAGAVLDDDVAALADLAGLHRDHLRRAGVGILERLVGVTHVALFCYVKYTDRQLLPTTCGGADVTAVHTLN